MHNFVTQFDNDCSLTSSSKIDGIFLPKPENEFIQYINATDLNSFSKVHIRSVKSICDKQQIRVNTLRGRLAAKMSNSLKQQAEFIMMLRFWEYRGAYWYFIKKYCLSLRRLFDRPKNRLAFSIVRTND